MRSYFTRKFAALLMFSLCVLSLQFAVSQTYAQSAEEHFRAGLEALQKSNLEQARTSFNEGLKVEPTNITLLYNLGLTEYKAKNTGLALGLWRKALALDPGNDDVTHAIQYAENALPQRVMSRGSDLYESFRNALLIQNSLLSFMVLALVLFVFTGWILIRYFAARVRAFENEEAGPSIPFVGIILAAFFILATGLVATKLYDLSITRATLISEKVEVKTSPDPSSATLFELFEGFEVVVRQSTQGWLQVDYPGGLSGWIPTNSVFLTGRQL